MNSSKVFGPKRTEVCFCGSGLRFKSCCGSIAADRRPPHGIQVVENFIDPDLCRRLTEFANASGGEPLKVVDPSATTTNNVVRMFDDRRVTEKVDVGPEQETLNKILRAALTEIVEPAVGSRIEWFEAPQLLRYRAGGFYKGHADSENFDPTTKTWSKVLDRDVSILLYLNDEYTGGSLNFPKFRYILRPKPGMLVFFPSDNRYFHSAESVLSGVRYALVSWASLYGAPKIHDEPPSGALSLHN
jgi:predicted 2-oxoglutarate/Fe(II)-dependent dioxygenase YbiX